MNGQHYAYIQVKQKSYHANHLYREVPLTFSMYDQNLKKQLIKQKLAGVFTVLTFCFLMDTVHRLY